MQLSPKTVEAIAHLRSKLVEVTMNSNLGDPTKCPDQIQTSFQEAFVNAVTRTVGDLVIQAEGDAPAEPGSALYDIRDLVSGDTAG